MIREMLEPAPNGNRDIRLVQGAEFINVLGSQVTMLAIPTMAVLMYQASELQVSLILVLEYLPAIIARPLVGYLVDNFPLKRLMITANLIAGVTAGIIPILHMLGTDNLTQLYVVAAMLGLFRSVHDMSVVALVPRVTGEKSLIMRFNSDIELGRSVGRTAGWGVGGSLVQAVGPAMSLLFDALSFFTAVFLLGFLKNESSTLTERPRTLFSFSDGIASIRKYPLLARLAVAMAALNLGGSAIGGLYLFYAYRVLDLTPVLVGLTVMLNFFGSFVGVTLFKRFVAPSGQLPRAVFASAVISGSVYFLIPLASVSWPLVLLGFYNFFFGLFATVWAISTVSIRQIILPKEILGQVNASIGMIANVTIPIGYLLGGLASVKLGIVPTLFASAILGFTAWLWLLPLARAQQSDL